MNQKQTYQDVKLSMITLNPLNPRKVFEGRAFDELVASIRVQGVIEPVIVRTLNGKKKLQLVAGERRFRAASVVAKGNGGLGKHTIPALVRTLSDDEAFELMTIENLQREDLNELDEARSYRAFVERNGDEAVADLAGRIGVGSPYIRRRMAVLSLPEAILEAWGQGDIQYGYLEQLLRVEDEDSIMEFFEDVQEGCITSVRGLKRVIDNASPDLSKAVFNLQQEGCLTCQRSTEVQKKLFELDSDKAAGCTKPECFHEKQRDWLNRNWSETDYAKNHGTNGFRYKNEVEHGNCYTFQGNRKPGEACASCEAFITLFEPKSLYVYSEAVCVGEYACFEKIRIEATPKNNRNESTTATTKTDKKQRGAWHGEHFREVFLMDEIPKRFEKLEPRGLAATHLALFALIKSEPDLHDWFAEKHDLEKTKYEYFYRLSSADIFRPIMAMPIDEAAAELKEATLRVVLRDGFLHEGRLVAGEYLGISLADEWSVTQDYLEKKTKSDMLGFGEKEGILKDPKAVKFLGKLGRKRFKDCKKQELIDVFLESGVELVGRVPEEILSIGK